MKIILLIVACAVGGWYWLSSREITENEVQKFYLQEQEWISEQKPKELCALLDEKYSERSTVISVEGRSVREYDKSQACQSMTELFDAVGALRSKVGNVVGVEINQNIGRIEIGSDKKTAKVHVSSVFTMGTSQVKFMKISGETDETFIKRKGKLLRLSAEGKSFVE